MSAQTAAQANEYQANIGQDIYTSCELAEFEAEADDEAERQRVNQFMFDYFYS